MKKSKKISRIASQLPIAAQPAGTPTAASAQEAPSPQVAAIAANSGNTPEEISVGETYPEVTTGSIVAAEVRSECNKLNSEQRRELAVKAEKIINSAPRGGAAFFIPPQKPSGFGVKKD